MVLGMMLNRKKNSEKFEDSFSSGYGDGKIHSYQDLLLINKERKYSCRENNVTDKQLPENHHTSPKFDAVKKDGANHNLKLKNQRTNIGNNVRSRMTGNSTGNQASHNSKDKEEKESIWK